MNDTTSADSMVGFSFFFSFGICQMWMGGERNRLCYDGIPKCFSGVMAVPTRDFPPQKGISIRRSNFSSQPGCFKLYPPIKK